MASSSEEFTFFWQNKSPFSQWYPINFVVNEVEYNCAEQYMMHQKAVLFGDEDVAEQILGSDNPREQKALGRKVANFNEDVWNSKCRDIVKDGNKAKFSQNAELKAALLETVGTTLVEASPHDRIWGIGLSAEDPKARIKREWRGKNWLGYCLTQVRDSIIAQEGAAQ